MQSDHSILISRNRNRPQLTAKTALCLAEIAYAENRSLDAARLINIAHAMFEKELPANYQPADWIEDADDNVGAT